MIYVSKDARGHFNTIEKALESVKEKIEPVTIYIYDGIYKEKLIINRPNITLLGESNEGTIITYQNYAKMPMNDGTLCGTFRSFTMMIDANNVTLKNLTIENASGSGTIVGQAIALYADGDKITVDNCRLLSSQDTLFTGPLPPTPYEANGFIGPKEFAPRINGRQHYKKCFIMGDIDFIFGSATAYFEKCTLYSIRRIMNDNDPIHGYVTAPSTPEGQTYGYVFYQCDFISNCPKHSVYLGRPWRNFGKVVLIDCNIGEHIKEEGWHDWNKLDAHYSTFFAEYGSKLIASDDIIEDKRVPWSHILSKEDSLFYTKEKVLSTLD